jgi:uncharacterized protein (TIGR02996 family)
MSAADRAAFLRAIAANPDDDLPRLVYADWLDEHGEPERAEFIRLQCELARLPRDDPRWPELTARQDALWAAHSKAWCPPPARDFYFGQFERGFIGTVVARNFPAFTNIPEPLLAVHPIDRLIIRRMRPQHLRALAAMPMLARVTDLYANDGTISNDAIQAFARSPYIDRLRELNLSRNRIGDVGAQSLAEAPGLANLRMLSLAGNVIGDAGGEALAAAPHWRTMGHLVLRNNHLSVAARSLLRARYGDAVKL